MKGEIWKDIEGYEGLYQVSNMGRVKSLNYKHTGKEGILKPYGNGYLQVELCKEGNREQPLVHVLVATAFLDNVDNLPEVNHKDEDKENNYVENLEWCSKLYNANYGTRSKRSAEKRRGRKQTEEQIKKKSKPVFSVDKESGLIMWWESIMEAERVLGINHSNITKCCKGKANSAGGHIWFYDDDTK